MGLSKPIIITSSAVDTSNLATKSDMTTLQNSVTSALSKVGGAVKKIQRGVLSTSNADTTAVTLSGFDDLGKMAVFLEGINGFYGKNDAAGADIPYVSELTVSKLTIGHYYSNSYISQPSVKISYTVVQFT